MCSSDLLGPDTAAVPEASGPHSVTLDCPGSPPADGKITCDLQVVGNDGTVWWNGPAGIGLHGRSSSGFPKPQWAVELRDDSGAQVSADLLDMGSEADWLLNGMWIDRALLRNKIAYDLFRDLTADHDWAPESRYVEVTYNGSYYGLFALVERIDRDGGRVDIPEDDGTGSSFLVKADEVGIVSSVQYGLWSVLYPTSPTAEQTAGITARIGQMESLIAVGDDAVWDQLDLDSAVAFVLLEEGLKNNDGFFLSHHLYTRADGKLGFVPWDLDLSCGQPSYNDNENPRSWLAYRPTLVAQMPATAQFSPRMEEMWAEWRAGDLADDALDARIDGIVADLGDSVDRNFERWPIEDVDFYGYLYDVGSHEEEIHRVKTFLHARFAWMDEEVGSY